MKNELHLLKPQSKSPATCQRVGVVLPVSDSSPQLRQCLAALTHALARAVSNGHQADLYVVVDGRDADSAAIAASFAVHLVTADFSELAAARVIGARAALGAGATWLAFTQSDALVADSWLIEQIASNTELLFGAVEITNGFMADRLQDMGRDWEDLPSYWLQQMSANFSNLGMSRSAFEMALHLGGDRMRLDGASIDRLTTLEIETHRCSKPLVYARSKTIDEILLTADTPAQPARVPVGVAFSTSAPSQQQVALNAS